MLGHSLADELLGQVSFGELAFWLMAKRRPTPQERIMFEAVLGRKLPLNGAGACGAVLADVGLPLGVARGVALLSRCAGLLGHLAEELDDPIGNDIFMTVDRNVDYRPPPK